MAQQYIDTGSVPNSVGGESLRSAFDKVNDNFDELEINTNPNFTFSLLLYGSPFVRRQTGTNGGWYDLPFRQSSGTTSWKLINQDDSYFRASSSGSVLEISIREIPNVNDNILYSDSSEYTLGIKKNPEPGDSISTTNFDYEEDFNFSLAVSKSLYPNLEFVDGDIIGLALYKNASTPQYMTYNIFVFFKQEI